LTINPAKLDCSVPEFSFSGIEIPQPLTCNNGRTPTNITWSESAPNWSNPAIGTYGNISATATCGRVSGLTVNCSGSLSVVSCPEKDNTSTHYCSEGTIKKYVILTDTRDDKTYKAVAIGTQTWMAENLNYNASGSKCYTEANCEKYGRLYDWETAMTVCPVGWHLPSQTEWEVMTNFIGGASTEGKKLKATSGWSNNGNGTNDYGFSALPGGEGFSVGSFSGVGDRGYWWSASENSSDRAYSRFMNRDIDLAFWDNDHKSSLFSVRCVQD
jgi:uncharacterized protein (TIGR02145 family)